MPAQDKLTPTEQYLAYLTGLGITISLIALLLIGMGTIDNSNVTNSLLIIGLAMVIIGVGGWLVMVRPWEHFDDLTTPFYTGHHEHAATPETPASAVAEAVSETPVVEAAAPAAETPDEPDDLTTIEGIGPKSAQALHAAGITSFAQIAAMTPEALENTVKSQGVRLVGGAEHWPQQARLAAAGDLTALEDFQQRVKSGLVTDDLTMIEGIGPKSAQALNAAGITRFIQVAAMSPEELESLIKSSGVRLVASTETWPQQARLAAEADVTALEELKARIKSGIITDGA